MLRMLETGRHRGAWRNRQPSTRRPSPKLTSLLRPKATDTNVQHRRSLVPNAVLRRRVSRMFLVCEEVLVESQLSLSLRVCGASCDRRWFPASKNHSLAPGPF
mmetsp:Transcript_5044/g.20152  ORF Transcript_5044/g.20152 Transcript_5044/m.20152 type:complete len:103 (+) Transcript_5044:470-778(+)